MSLSPAQVTAMRATLRAIREELRPLDPEAEPDDKLFVNTAEGQTEVMEEFDDLLQDIVADTVLLERLAERARRIEARRERNREAVQLLMQDMELRSIQRDCATVTVSKGRESLQITGDVPDEYTKLVRQTDKDAIRELLKADPDLHLNWAKLVRGAEILMVKSK